MEGPPGKGVCGVIWEVSPHNSCPRASILTSVGVSASDTPSLQPGGPAGGCYPVL